MARQATFCILCGQPTEEWERNAHDDCIMKEKCRDDQIRRDILPGSPQNRGQYGDPASAPVHLGHVA
jgi:hypothetical protein